MKNQPDGYFNWQVLRHGVGILVCSFCLAWTAAQADETEIFAQNDASSVNNNILFLLDVSGSMGSIVPDSEGKTRLKVLQETFKDVITQAPSNVNVGLLHYANSSNGSEFSAYNWNAIKGVSFPISSINANATSIIGSAASTDYLPDPPASGIPVRNYLSNVVDSWSPSGYTPIVDALYEATRYFRGEAPVWGAFARSSGGKEFESWHAHPSTYATGACSQYNSVTCNKDNGECTTYVNEQKATLSDCRTEEVSCNILTDLLNGCALVPFSFPPRYTMSANTCQANYCAVQGKKYYKSPIRYTCQANYIVLMSDGKPEYLSTSANLSASINTYPQSVEPGNASGGVTLTPARTQAQFPYTIPKLVTTPALDSTGMSSPLVKADAATICVDDPQGFKSGKCGAELTRFLATRDQAVLIQGTQTVKTYTIAFGLDDPDGMAYLASLATVEGGAYTAKNRDGLADAFNNILSNIQQRSLSFSSPSFTVDENQFLSQGTDVYVPVFDASRSTLWSGNLRKYKMDAQGVVVGKRLNGSPGPAFTDKGTINPDVMDFWSKELHGIDASIGGAASLLKPAERTIWTDINTTSGSVALVRIQNATTSMLTPTKRVTRNSLLPWDQNPKKSCWGNYKDCSGTEHTVEGDLETGAGCVDIAQVTTCPGIQPTESERETLVNFALGYKNGNPDAGARYHMGDTLNTKPVSVNYGNGKNIVFLGTNEGYLHAFDANSGKEHWAYIPRPLLKNIGFFMSNDSGREHLYGIDGALTVLRKDKNNDGIIRRSDGDSVYVFFGLRRGGRDYYALDITEPNSPRLLWWNHASRPGFNTLGEAWSKPTLSRMRVQNGNEPPVVKDVLVFGAGFDPNKEEQSPKRPEDNWGKDVYIVSLETGELIWSLQQGYNRGGAIKGANKLKHSITGDIRILDMDSNGSLDRLYFADTGGNVWRVDLDADIYDSDPSYYDYQDALLTQIADLGGGNGNKDHRKFYYEPDTAMRMQNGKPILTIALGSGYRSHPLDTEAEQDRFYVLIDPNPYGLPPNNFKPITEANLMDANTIEAGKNILNYMSSDKNIFGWYLPLTLEGEKVLSSAFTFLDKVMFTSFSVVDEAGKRSVPAPCEPGKNTSRAYILDLLSGRGVLDLDGAKDSNGQKAPDRFKVVGAYELMEAPQLVFGSIYNTKDGSACTGAGQDCKQNIQIQIGKYKLPLMDVKTVDAINSTQDYNQMIDVTRLLPRLYWLDNSVTGGKGAATAP